MPANSTTPAELVSVRVGGQAFALDLVTVREIRGWTTSTPPPHAPDYVLGLIDLREGAACARPLRPPRGAAVDADLDMALPETAQAA